MDEVRAIRDTLSMRRWYEQHFPRGSGRAIKIAVIDSGWRTAWRDSRVEQGFTVYRRVDDGHVHVARGSEDAIGHGSACTLLLREIAPGASILPIRVFLSRLETSATIVTRALEAAVAASADVVNMSLATRSRLGMTSLYEACERAARAGVVIVASADRMQAGLPAEFDNVLGVAGASGVARLGYAQSATARLDFVACDATYVTRPDRAGTQLQVRGSTFAAPVLSGIVALLRERYGGLHVREVVDWLQEHEPRYE